MTQAQITYRLISMRADGKTSKQAFDALVAAGATFAQIKRAAAKAGGF